MSKSKKDIERELDEIKKQEDKTNKLVESLKKYSAEELIKENWNTENK